MNLLNPTITPPLDATHALQLRLQPHDILAAAKESHRKLLDQQNLYFTPVRDPPVHLYDHWKPLPRAYEMRTALCACISQLPHTTEFAAVSSDSLSWIVSDPAPEGRTPGVITSSRAVRVMKTPDEDHQYLCLANYRETLFIGRPFSPLSYTGDNPRRWYVRWLILAASHCSSPIKKLKLETSTWAQEKVGQLSSRAGLCSHDLAVSAFKHLQRLEIKVNYTRRSTYGELQLFYTQHNLAAHLNYAESLEVLIIHCHLHETVNHVARMNEYVGGADFTLVSDSTDFDFYTTEYQNGFFSGLFLPRLTSLDIGALCLSMDIFTDWMLRHKDTLRRIEAGSSWLEYSRYQGRHGEAFSAWEQAIEELKLIMMLDHVDLGFMLDFELFRSLVKQVPVESCSHSKWVECKGAKVFSRLAGQYLKSRGATEYPSDAIVQAELVLCDDCESELGHQHDDLGEFGIDGGDGSNAEADGRDDDIGEGSMSEGHRGESGLNAGDTTVDSPSKQSVSRRLWNKLARLCCL